MRCHFVIFFILFTVSPVLADEIRIGTGVSVANEILRPIEAAFEQRTGHDLIIIQSGPDAAVNSLKAGKIDAAGIIYTPEEIKAIFKKNNQPYLEQMFQHEALGLRRLVVILNKANEVKSLTKEQLKGILTGKIKNWKDIGGADMPVLTVLGNKAQGINELYRRSVLDGAPFARDLHDADTGAQVKARVVMYDGAIGIVTANLADQAVTVPEQPIVHAQMYLYTKGKPSIKVQSLLDFIRQTIN